MRDEARASVHRASEQVCAAAAAAATSVSAHRRRARRREGGKAARRRRGSCVGLQGSRDSADPRQYSERAAAAAAAAAAASNMRKRKRAAGVEEAGLPRAERARREKQRELQVRGAARALGRRDAASC
eukprot:scaffold523_cov446-Prasinococcus_capsulatus_cf.AAC.21